MREFEVFVMIEFEILKEFLLVFVTALHCVFYRKSILISCVLRLGLISILI